MKQTKQNELKNRLRKLHQPFHSQIVRQHTVVDAVSWLRTHKPARYSNISYFIVCKLFKYMTTENIKQDLLNIYQYKEILLLDFHFSRFLT